MAHVGDNFEVERPDGGGPNGGRGERGDGLRRGPGAHGEGDLQHDAGGTGVGHVVDVAERQGEGVAGPRLHGEVGREVGDQSPVGNLHVGHVDIWRGEIIWETIRKHFVFAGTFG